MTSSAQKLSVLTSFVDLTPSQIIRRSSKGKGDCYSFSAYIYLPAQHLSKQKAHLTTDEEACPTCLLDKEAYPPAGRMKKNPRPLA